MTLQSPDLERVSSDEITIKEKRDLGSSQVLLQVIRPYPLAHVQALMHKFQTLILPDLLYLCLTVIAGFLNGKDMMQISLVLRQILAWLKVLMLWNLMI